MYIPLQRFLKDVTNISQCYVGCTMSPKIRKKDPCPCGSGKKYRDCCLKTEKYRNMEISREMETCIDILEELLPLEPISLMEYELIMGSSRLTMMKIQQDILEDTTLLKITAEEMRKSFAGMDWEKVLREMWNSKKVEKMSTEAIVEKLETMNVHFDGEQLKKLAQGYISAIELSDRWYYPDDRDVIGVDKDFIWLSICELWKRFIPERYNVEMLDDALHTGYIQILHANYEEGLKEWEAAWEMVKTLVPAAITSVEGADIFMPYPLTHTLTEWCQDFVDELCTAEQRDASYAVKKTAYINEFFEKFPDTDNSLLEYAETGLYQRGTEGAEAL